MPWSSLPFRSTHMHCTSYLASHAMSCIMLLVHCNVIDCCSVACVLALGRAGRRVRERGSCRVCLWGASFRQPWELCRQDDYYPYITSIFACSLFALSLCRATYHLFIMPPILPCQASNPPFLANRCLAMLPLCSAPLLELLVAGEDEVCSWSEHGYFGISQYLLFN